MFYGLIALCGILSFLGVRSSYYPLKWAAGFCWWGMFVYWLQADLVVDGTPTDVIVMLLFVMLGILFVMWGMAGRGKVYDIETTTDDTGRIISTVYKGMSRDKSADMPSTESTLEYRNRVRKAAHGGRTHKRR